METMPLIETFFLGDSSLSNQHTGQELALDSGKFCQLVPSWMALGTLGDTLTHSVSLGVNCGYSHV